MFASLIYVFTVLPLIFATAGATNIASSPYDQEAYYCLLPPYPEHGSYKVSNYPYAKPGDRYSSVKLDITCDPGYLNTTIKSIFCVNGDWSASMPTCVWDLFECDLQHQQLEDKSSKHLELPWHAVIYRKSSDYEYISSGSLLTATKIISPAHIFYDDEYEPIPLSEFVVVASNKMYSKYNVTLESNSQHSNVIDIKVPSNYRRKEINIQYFDYNIAIVVVEKPFQFHMSVRPACLFFDTNLNSTHLIKGSSGKTIRWSSTGDSDQSKVLTVVDMPYLNYEDCKNMMWAEEHRQRLAKSQFCARYDTGIVNDVRKNAIQLAFLGSSQQYYLRGIIAIFNPIADVKAWVVSYTPIAKHEDFIKQHL